MPADAPPPQLRSVDAPRDAPRDGPRRAQPPRRFGPLVAGLGLIGALALLVAAVAGIPPFGSASPTPSTLPTTGPSAAPTASATPSSSVTATPVSAAEIRAELARIEEQMTRIRELSAGQPLDPKLIGSAEASTLLTADFNAENPAALVAAQTRLDRALGLLTPQQDLATAYQKFLATQVLGFYRDTDKSLYIVSDQGFGPLERLTAAHEYTHALQDTHFHLSSIQSKATDQGDLGLARVALPEGDATLAMTQWAIAELTPDEISQLSQQLQDPIAEQALADAPPIVRDTEEFPYSDGLAFVQRAWAQGGWSAVDQLWQHPPDTTEQVLHPGKYDAHEGAVAVALPTTLPGALGSGWKSTLQDTMGELQSRIWLEQALDPATAATAAGGWGGDRIGFYEGPDGAWAVAWLTEWDSAADAREFEAGAQQVAARLQHAAVYPNPPNGKVVGVIVTSDQALISKVAAALGVEPD